MATLLLSGCAVARPPLELTDTVIDGVQVWSGEVRIRGVVTGKKTGHLTILPGTRVVFAPLDRDGDGIGDGELLIEGGGRQTRSSTTAIPWPTPMHIVHSA